VRQGDLPLGFVEPPLGKGAQHIGIKMLSRARVCLQANAYGLWKLRQTISLGQNG
jgi:hypothetical protein